METEKPGLNKALFTELAARPVSLYLVGAATNGPDFTLEAVHLKSAFAGFVRFCLFGYSFEASDPLELPIVRDQAISRHTLRLIIGDATALVKSIAEGGRDWEEVDHYLHHAEAALQTLARRESLPIAQRQEALALANLANAIRNRLNPNRFPNLTAAIEELVEAVDNWYRKEYQPRGELLLPAAEELGVGETHSEFNYDLLNVLLDRPLDLYAVLAATNGPDFTLEGHWLKYTTTAYIRWCLFGYSLLCTIRHRPLNAEQAALLARELGQMAAAVGGRRRNLFEVLHHVSHAREALQILLEQDPGLGEAEAIINLLDEIDKSMRWVTSRRAEDVASYMEEKVRVWYAQHFTERM